MAVEFDHLFICTDIGAPEAVRLVEFGLLEGTSSTHPGQGTANRRFFFHNAMVELLWVHASEEAQSEPIRRTYLWERWSQRSNMACPFGIGLRPSFGSDDAPIFSSWDYRPPYLPAALSIAVGCNSAVLTEPMLFQIPFGQRPDRYPPEKAQPLEHRIGLRNITRVEMSGASIDGLSPEFQAVLDAKVVQLSAGSKYCMEIGFDGEGKGQKVDFRPSLPLIVSW